LHVGRGGYTLVRKMSRVALIRHVAAGSPERLREPAGSASVEPEHVEEVWDAELVSELPSPGWLAVPALTTYLRAGRRMPPPLVDVHA
jgi:hypothetical protein